VTPELTVYLREGCSLCEDMVAALAPLQAELAFGLRVVDVDSDPQLVDAYGDRVPVLAAPGGELCHYFLDHEMVRRYFAAP
jgi:thiol-disulfide isomerase/thioredoxin